MSSFGVLDTGFVKKSLDDILAELEADQRADISAGLSLLPDTFFGDLNGIFGDKLRELWDIAQALHEALGPDGASGVSLANLAAITGALQLDQAKSTRTLILNLDDATTLPSGSVVSVGTTGDRFATTASVTNSSGAQGLFAVASESEQFGPIAGPAGAINTIETPITGWEAKAAIKSQNVETYALTDGQTLLVQVNGGSTQTATFNTGDFVSIIAATAAEVAAVIGTDITDVTASDQGGFVFIESDTISATPEGAITSVEIVGGTANPVIGFSTAISRGMNPSGPATLTSGSSETYVLANEDTLKIKVNSGSEQVIEFLTAEFVAIGSATAEEVSAVINTKATGVLAFDVGGDIVLESETDGINSLLEITGGTANTAFAFSINPVNGTSGDATVGRNVETDPAFRLRREQLIRLIGASAVDAVRAAVLAVSDVTQAFVFENTSLVTVGGIPGKAFETVVVGGTDVAVAQAIFDTKPAGIKPFGTSSESIVDSQGTSHTIGLSRPTDVPIFFDLTINADAANFPVNGVDQVKSALKAFGDTLVIGDDIIALKFKCEPLTVDGVVDVPAFALDKTASPTATANIPIDPRELASFDTTDMTVTVNFV